MSPIEKINTTKTFLKTKVTKKQQEYIEKILETKNSKQQQFFIDFLFGFIKNKPKALKEDLQYAFDVASFYKDKPERFDFKNIKPFDLGSKNFKEISEKFDSYLKSKNKSLIQKAKQNGNLINGITVNILYQDEKYKLYFIPKLKDNHTPEELDIQHLKFCFVGHGTDWCTANPEGSYYQKYTKHDIYTVHKNNKPFMQFNIVNQKIKQMMDINDTSLPTLNKEVLQILEKVFNDKL